MNFWLNLGYIVIIIIALTYFVVILLYNYRQNPDASNTSISDTESQVTINNLGQNGDMGNQIMQISTLLASAKRSGAIPILPTRISSLPIFNLFDFSDMKIEDINIDREFREHDNYEKIIIPRDGKKYNIRGYRQSYKYFDDCADEVRRVLQPKPEILESVKGVVPENYIAVHIRRGDYIKAKHNLPFCKEFIRCQLEYYKSGIKVLRETYPDCELLVCTDDQKWVEPLLDELDENCKLAPTIEGFSPKFTDFTILYLAQGIVISNSTYSWTAAYLNGNSKVVCPTPWWDPTGFMGKGMGLDGPYLHHPDWYLLDATDGKLVTKDRPDTNHHTLTIYKMFRGFI